MVRYMNTNKYKSYYKTTRQREKETFAQKTDFYSKTNQIHWESLNTAVWGTLSVMVFPSEQVSKLMLKAVLKTPNTKFKHTEHHSAVPSSQYPRERERLQS